MKRCARCKVEKPSELFYRNKQWRDGLHPYCKACLLAYQRKRRLDPLAVTRPHRRQWARSRDLREAYFERLETATQAYVLGLISADGYVVEGLNRVAIELAAKDVELVELVRDELAPSVEVKARVAHARDYRVFTVSSARLASDLAKYGVVPRKSHTLTWPEIPEHLERPYLLGFFDGDGSAFIDTCNSTPSWTLLGQRSFLEAAQRVVSREIGVTVGGPWPKRRDGDLHWIKATGKRALSIDEWLHRDGLGLSRKRFDR